MPSRRGQAVYKRNVRRIRTICENAEHFLASFFQLSGGASPSLTGYARILQQVLLPCRLYPHRAVSMGMICFFRDMIPPMNTRLSLGVTEKAC